MSVNPNTVQFQLVPQPYIAPGLSYPENGSKFLGVFTATHLSICLLVAGFGLIVTGLLGVVTKASLDERAFHAVGISLITFGCLLIGISIAIFVSAIRWGRKRVHTLKANVHYPPIAVMPVNYSYPVIQSGIMPVSNDFEKAQTSSYTQQTLYVMQPNTNNQSFANYPQHLIKVMPSAPPAHSHDSSII